MFVSKNGFQAQGTSYANNNNNTHNASGAFSVNKDGWLTALQNTTGYLQLSYPEPITLWTVASESRYMTGRNWKNTS